MFKPYLQYIKIVVGNWADDLCWNWHILSEDGYGHTISTGSKKFSQLSPHKVAYETRYGFVPYGLVLDHLCRNRACWNPDHLEVVTNKINIQRGASASKTSCVNGHEFTPENTYQYGTRQRFCRECYRERNRAYYQRKKAAQNV